MPQDPNFVFGFGSATAQEKQAALSEARANAQEELASALDVKFEAMSKSFTEEASEELRRQYTALQAEVVDDAVQEATPMKTEVVQQDDGTWRASVLMDLSIGRAAQELLARIKKSEALSARFRSSQAYEEMKEAVEAYESEQ